jgi:hypothetical protein
VGPGLGLGLLVCLFACAVPVRTAQAQYSLSQNTIRIAEPVTILLPPGVDTLWVTYRPQSQIAIMEGLPNADSTNLITWTPERAGLVLLSSPAGGAQYVSVRYASLPWSGLFMLILAGTILIGGAGLSMYRLLQAEAAGV